MSGEVSFDVVSEFDAQELRNALDQVRRETAQRYDFRGATVDLQQGKGEQVVKDLRAMLEKGDSPVPQDVLLHELGMALEQLKRPQEAVQAYQRILDEFPQSPYRPEAQQKVTALDPTRAASPFGGLQGIPGFPG